MSRKFHIYACVIYGSILGIIDNFIIYGEELLYLGTQQIDHRGFYLNILVFLVLVVRYPLLILAILSEKTIVSTLLALLSAFGWHLISWGLCVKYQIIRVIEHIVGISPTSWTDGVIGLAQAFLLGEMLVVNICLILISCLSLLYRR